MAFEPGDPVLELEAAGHDVPTDDNHWYIQALSRIPVYPSPSLEYPAIISFMEWNTRGQLHGHRWRLHFIGKLQANARIVV